MSRPKTIFAWSSGKDSAWALHLLRQQGEYEVVGLLTTLNEAFDRVAMHGVRSELLHAQAKALKLPLYPVKLPWPCSNEAYDCAMAEAMTTLEREGITVMAFGDLFLEDIRRYREEKLRGTKVSPLFPLWGKATANLAQEMLAGGLRARLTCVDPRQVPATYAAREFDQTLLQELAPGVDPCGENGEFHSFAYDGPMFTHPIPVHTGEVVEREGFVFADLLLGEAPRLAET